jgi:hypothetical protein
MGRCSFWLMFPRKVRGGGLHLHLASRAALRHFYVNSAFGRLWVRSGFWTPPGAFRKAERWDKAADLFEEAKDYASAAQCYRRLGHAPAHMRMLEAGGDYVAAAELSETLGDPVRVAQLWLKAKQPEKAALWWNKAGKPAGDFGPFG